MIREYEYHIISHILFALHAKLFIDKVFFKDWKWDFYHIYFVMIIIYLICIIIYGNIVYFYLKELDLKNFPVENIVEYRNCSNRKNLHPYCSFERKDLVDLKYINLLYGIIFVATWKLAAVFIISVINLSLCLLILFILKTNDEDEDSAVLKFYIKFLKLASKASLWIFGINKIESHYLCDKEWPKNIVSNHVSAIDPFYFISEHDCSFVAKKSLRKDRFIGASVRALKCVFVYREKLEDRKIALETIKERQLLINDKKNNCASLVIFSEGTTSNGMQLIEQKKGAFFSLLPITPVLLVYDYDIFNPAYDVLPFLWWVFLSAANYQSMQLRTYWLPKVYLPDKIENNNLSEEEKINIFHDEVSKIMFQSMKKYNPRAPQDIDDYRDWPGSLRLKREYFETALGKVAIEQLNKEKILSEK